MPKPLFRPTTSLLLRLVAPLPEAEPAIDLCHHCGKPYKKQHRFWRAGPSDGKHLVVEYADPAAGFARARDGIRRGRYQLRPVPLSLFGLPTSESVGINDLARLPSREWGLFLHYAIDDPDPKVRWSRLRALSMRRFQHQRPVRDRRCQKLVTVGLPATINEWASPLFAALYVLGLSYRDIVAKLALGDPGQVGIHTSVGRAVREYIPSQYRVEMMQLHRQNRRKFVVEPRLDNLRFDWEVDVRGPLDTGTRQMLRTLAGIDAFGQYFSIEFKAQEGAGPNVVAHRRRVKSNNPC